MAKDASTSPRRRRARAGCPEPSKPRVLPRLPASPRPAAGAFAGVEALLRWRHPTRGAPRTRPFMAELADSDLIVGGRALGAGDRVPPGRPLAPQGYRFSVSVNIAPRQFARRDFVDDVVAALTQSRSTRRCSPWSCPSARSSRATATSRRASRGSPTSACASGVDDFSLERSSLGLARALPCARSSSAASRWPASGGGSKGAQRLRALVDEARGRGVAVIASGIEDAAQRELLASEHVAAGPGLPLLPAARGGRDRPLPRGLRPLLRQAPVAMAKDKGQGKKKDKRKPDLAPAPPSDAARASGAREPAPGQPAPPAPRRGDDVGRAARRAGHPRHGRRERPRRLLGVARGRHLGRAGAARRGRRRSDPGRGRGAAPRRASRTGGAERAGPWAEGGWLSAPLRPEGARARGVVAVARDAEPSDADPEVLTLLAQSAATALAAVELARGVANSEARLRVLVETAPVGLVEVGRRGRGAVVERGGQPRPRLARVPAGRRGARVPRRRARRPRRALARGRRRRAGGRARDRRRRDRQPQPAADRRRGPPAPHRQRAAGVLTLIDDVTDTRQLRAEVRHAHTMEMRGQLASRLAHDFNNLLTLVVGLRRDPRARDLRDDDRSARWSRTSRPTDVARVAAHQPAPDHRPHQGRGAGGLRPGRRRAPPTPRSSSGSSAAASSSSSRSTPDAGTIKADADQFEQMIINLVAQRARRDARGRAPHDRRGARRARRGAPRPPWACRPATTCASWSPTPASAWTTRPAGAASSRCSRPRAPSRAPGWASPRRSAWPPRAAAPSSVRQRAGRGHDLRGLLPARRGLREREAAPVAAEPPRGSATVLLADDDEALRHLHGPGPHAQRLPGHRGRRRGEAALAAVDAGAGETLDLLVSDVVMGEIGGRELAEALQARDPCAQGLLTSGTADPSVARGPRPGRASLPRQALQAQRAHRRRARAPDPRLVRRRRARIGSPRRARWGSSAGGRGRSRSWRAAGARAR